jgi:hypothetical protein
MNESIIDGVELMIVELVNVSTRLYWQADVLVIGDLGGAKCFIGTTTRATETANTYLPAYIGRSR